jgi:hypothetical protein
MNVRGFGAVAAVLSLSGCGVSGESAAPSSDTSPNESSPPVTAAQQPEPPPEPSTKGSAGAPGPAPASTTSAAVAFDVELVDEDHLANLTATGMAEPSVEVGGFWLIERWRDDRWVTFAHVGDSASTSGTIRICLDAEGAEGCEQSLESRVLQPGQYSFRRNVNIGVLPPGTYRVRLDSSAESTSDHLVIDSAGASVVEQEP